MPLWGSFSKNAPQSHIFVPFQRWVGVFLPSCTPTHTQLRTRIGIFAPLLFEKRKKLIIENQNNIAISVAFAIEQEDKRRRLSK